MFGVFALGPFVQAAGLNTYVPGPWALLRYVPVVGLARMPGRFSIVLMLAVAILFACALSWLGRRWPARRRVLVASAAALLAIELLPAPRPVYSAAIPRIYRHVALAPADVRVLELPFGVRDGTGGVGNLSPGTQFFQTAHGKRLISGYLSRIPPGRVSEIRRDDMLDALIRLSEGRTLDASREKALIEAGPAFTQRTNVGFVVVDRASTPDALREFAIRALDLQPIAIDAAFALYRPAPERRGR